MTQYLNINTEIMSGRVSLTHHPLLLSAPQTPWQGVTDPPLTYYYYLLPKHPGGSRHPCGATSKAHLGTQFVSELASKKSGSAKTL